MMIDYLRYKAIRLIKTSTNAELLNLVIQLLLKNHC
jgi:hypothetical protein